MDVLLIGGGIGGLAAALALQRVGIAACICEAASQSRPDGVGINLHPHAVREFSTLGLEPALARRGVLAREMLFFNGHGQLIHDEPCGQAAGQEHPQITIHRTDLHEILLDAVRERLGPAAIHMGLRCVGLEQDGGGVTVHFSDPAGDRAPSIRADVAIGCDGLHSAARRWLHPDEPPPLHSGHIAWRGVVRSKPFRSGASIALIGTFQTGMAAVYPIRTFADGTQLLSLTAVTAAAKGQSQPPSDTARLDDFIEQFEGWRFDWIDIPGLFARMTTIRRQPLLEREPLDRWTFSRVTLLGDAAHPMSPRGGNGAAQAIIDGSALARHLAGDPDPLSALQKYEAERRPTTSEIVRTSRHSPPDTIIAKVDKATGGRPFANLGAVADRKELGRILENYKRITGASPRHGPATAVTS
jgi:2-polyprenyl-6-methoxyphenol hydroxylase-like FAD-dependent oxidoreductase